MSLASYLQKLRNKQSLAREEAHKVFDSIFVGDLSENEIAAFLLALHRKGESVEEILGAVESMRSKAVLLNAPSEAIDIVGTGGDAKGTFNISTATSLVVAGCGVPVAKHGNRAATSKSGSSDVLAALGINLEPPMEVLERCLAEANLCFLFAPRHHPAMRFVAQVRKKLGVRTIFNLLGPLTNPAGVKRHLIGVFSAQWLMPMAETLHELGSVSAWLTHGQDGMDEITTVAKSDVVSLNGNELQSFTLDPADAGITLCAPQDLQGGDAAHNAEAIRKLLDGEKGAYRDIVEINAAAALVVAEKAADLREGAAMASKSIDNGAALEVLQKLVELTNKGTI
ncbi:MAG: anthranilate phosphoribosyltransferase [Alphaproteobacteria bacterium]|nr:anthranilate phosphoribosyltransferase [Alphaproteobacteria bacterium]